MPAIYHEGSWLGNATDPEVLVKDTVGWTGKNLLKNTATNKTGGNVAWVVNADKSITINTSESASSVQTLYIGEVTGLQGDYILNGVTGGSLSTYGIQLYDVTTSTWITQYAVDGDSTINLADKNHTYRFVAYVRQGVSVSNITIYPMLRRADITDPTYEPYHESVEEEIEQIYADNGVLGVKNLLPNNATSQTINGVTFTVNDDGSVTANGTATAEALFTLHRYLIDIKLSGNLILNGCPTGGTNATYQIYLQRRNAENTRWDTPIYRDFGDGVNVTIEDGRLFDVTILIRNGATLNNLVFKPMLRLASDPDDTYQPYAMTNRELTEKVFEKRTLTSADDLNNVTETGIYGIITQPSNSPSSYATLIVNRRSDGGISQLIQKSDSMYTRDYGGNPAVWTSWYKFAGTVVS